jgi:hypothetical protein
MQKRLWIPEKSSLYDTLFFYELFRLNMAAEERGDSLLTVYVFSMYY